MPGHFSPIPVSRPSPAPQTLAGSWRLPVFALGLRLSFGQASWPARTYAAAAGGARCWPIVRLLQRAVLLEVVEDGADGLRLFDAGDDLHLAAAVDAGFHVDTEDALEPLRPGHRAALLVGRSIIRVGGFTRRIAALAAMRGRELRAQVRVRGKDAVEAGQVRARRRHQRRQFGDKVHRLKLHMRGAVAPRRFERVAHPALRRDR